MVRAGQGGAFAELFLNDHCVGLDFWSSRRRWFGDLATWLEAERRLLFCAATHRAGVPSTAAPLA
jgi:hypothetical protein